MNCPICNSLMSEPVQELFDLPSVTSDCRPWNKGRSVCICSGCGVMQRVTALGADFDTIYDGYKSYPEPEGRTQKILEFVKDKMPKPNKILDIGCGEGNGTKILWKFFDKCFVDGYDPYSEKFKDKPEGKFDLITLFHVLEHVEDIHGMLAYVKSSLNENGRLLIQVPLTEMWPFDLILADHWWHFTPQSLMTLLNVNGFIFDYIGNDPIKKETTVLAYVDEDVVANAWMYNKPKNSPIEWILNYKKSLDSIDEPVAVLGTGPAAAWVGSILGDKASYYLDDDKNRWGEFNGRAVYQTIDYSGELPIIAPFPDWQLTSIKEKHQYLRFL